MAKIILPYFTIYLVTNKLNGKVYVGQTNTTIEHRWYQHVLASTRNGVMAICHAIAKYGAENFIIEDIDHASTRDEANDFEVLYVAAYRSNNPKYGYNMTKGGAVINSGPLSEEHKRRISEAQKRNPNRAMLGHKHTPEAIAAMSAAKKGVVFTEEHKANISKARAGKPSAMLGRHHSEETRAKLSIKLTGKRHTKETKAKIGAAALGNTYGAGHKRSIEHLAAIAKGRAAYNALKIPVPEERRERLRQLRLGIPNTSEQKAKISASLKALKLKRSDAEKAAISAKNKGKKRTPEQIARIVAGQQAYREKVHAGKKRLV